MVTVRESVRHPIRPNVGGSGDPADFIGRRQTTARALAQLDRGENLILNDPRRMGKTQWLQALEYMQDASEKPLCVVHVDYEGVDTTDALLRRTVEALRTKQPIGQRVRAALKGLFGNLDADVSAYGVRLQLRPAWHEVDRASVLRQTIMAVDQHLDRVPVVLAMDELPTAIIDICGGQGQVEARLLLETLRKLRSETGRIRWILCGSVGMHHALRQAGATTGVINDLATVPFGPLCVEDARELAYCLFDGIDVSPTEVAVASLVAETDGIPFFMHAVAGILEQRASQNGASRAVDSADVSDAAARYLQDRELSHAATHLLARIDQYYGELAPRAYELLDRVASAATPVRVDDVREGGASRRLLDLLVDDHYLIEQLGQEQRLRWRYPVLERIWKVRRRL